MRLISAVPFLAVAIIMQTVDVQGFNEAVWSNADTAEAVLNFFSEFLEYTGFFSSYQMDEIKEIRDTISVLMDQMVLRKKTSSAIFQALDLAFASSIAKLIAKEDQGESLNRKKTAIFDAFKAAIKHVAGAEDPVYLNEIKELVSMFTSENPSSATSSGYQTAFSNTGLSKTESSVIAQVNTQDGSVPNKEVIYPISESQSPPQQLFNQGSSLFSAVSSIGGQSFESGIVQNTHASSAASSVAFAADINPQNINELNSAYPVVAYIPTVLTGAQPLQAPNMEVPQIANGDAAILQETNVASSVSTSAGISPNVNNPLSYGQSSDVVSSVNASLSSAGGENINEQSSKAKHTAIGLTSASDYQSNTPLSYGQSSDVASSVNASLSSAGGENSNEQSSKAKHTAIGLTSASDYQSNNPGFDSQSPAISIFVDSLYDNLYYSDAFYDVFESDINREQAVSALIKVTQYVSKDLGLDDIGNELVASVQRYTSTLSPSAGAAIYAVQYSSAIAEVLAKNDAITTETAIEDADIFADSVEDFFAETPISQLTAVVSTSSVGKQINEKDVVESSGSNTHKSDVQENSASIFLNENASKVISVGSEGLSGESGLSSELDLGRIDSWSDQNYNKDLAVNYGSNTDKIDVSANSPPNFADQNVSNSISTAPVSLSRESRLSSESALDRIDSVVSEIVTQEKINSANLGTIISKLGGMIRSDRPDLSECEMIDQVYSEILSALIHVLNTNDYYQDESSYVDESAAIVSGAMKYLM